MSLPRLGVTSPLVPPLYAAAVYTLPDLDALDAVYEGRQPGYVYARDGHPNAHLLASEMAALEGGAWGLVGGSGMAALSIAFLGLLTAGDRVVASDRLYGRTTKLLRQELPRFGVTTIAVDACDLDAMRSAVAANRPRVLFVETMSNPLCRIPDLPALAEVAHAHGCRLVVDNTFATPVLCKPLEMDADVVMESLTKMIGGHSDVTLGFLAGRDPELFAGLASLASTWGLSANPFDCWQAERGLHTLDLRMRAATANAAALADWLVGKPGVTRVAYPGRPDHPDHALAQRLFPAGCGNMFCFELAGGREAVNRFMRAAPGIPFSPSLGHTHTTISHPSSTSQRQDSPAEKQRQGITDGLVRVSAGCETFEAIACEMAKGLAQGAELDGAGRPWYFESGSQEAAMPQITIDDDIFQRLAERASRLHISVDQLVAPVLHAAANGTAEERSVIPPPPLSAEERQQVFDSLMADVAARADRYPPGFTLDVSRESMYEGCGE